MSADVSSLAVSLMARDLRSADAMLAHAKPLPRIGPATSLKAAIRSGWSDLPVDEDLLETARARTRELLHEYAEAGVERHHLLSTTPTHHCFVRSPTTPARAFRARGDLGPVSDARAVAVVGTREPSQFGITAAQQITTALARDGWVTVSGLAK